MLRKRKTPLDQLYPEKEALRNRPIKKDPKVQAFVDVEKAKQQAKEKITVYDFMKVMKSEEYKKNKTKCQKV